MVKPKKLQNYEIKAYQNIDDLWENIANENNYNHFAEILQKAIIQASKTELKF